MQVCHLPGSIADKLHSINRDFLWANNDTRKRVHLVNWNTVCRSRKIGGVGIRKTREANLDALTKLGWQVFTGEKLLWVQVLNAIYGRGLNPRD